MKHRAAMHGHLQGRFAEVITAGSHKPQLLNVEVGAEAGNAADVEGACRLHQHHHHIVHSIDVNGVSSSEVVEVGEQIGHRLRFHLKARHGWRFTADDLVHEHRIVALLGDPNKFWTHKPLSGEAMATGAVDAEQLPAMVGGAWKIEAGAYIGILAGIAQHPKHENNAS